METYNRSRTRLSKGQSFFEVIVALGLISIVLITLVAMAAASIRASVFSRNQTEANRFGEQAIEWLREEKNAGWTAFASHSPLTNACFQNLELTSQQSPPCTISGTVFARTLTLATNLDTSITATVYTSWTDAQGNHTVSSSTLFANWK